MDKQPKGTALSGYRVLDLTEAPGMLCTRLLSDMGAAVIRVEKPGGGNRQAPAYGYLNAGKRCISLDLERERGREIFRRLAAMSVAALRCSISHKTVSRSRPNGRAG